MPENKKGRVANEAQSWSFHTDSMLFVYSYPEFFSV